MIEELTEGHLSVYSDTRGEVLQLGELFGRELHVLSMEPGASRGNHIHSRDEIICVLGGRDSCEIHLIDEAVGQEKVFRVRKDLTAYRIRSGIRHKVMNRGKEAFYLVCLYD